MVDFKEGSGVTGVIGDVRGDIDEGNESRRERKMVMETRWLMVSFDSHELVNDFAVYWTNLTLDSLSFVLEHQNYRNS